MFIFGIALLLEDLEKQKAFNKNMDDQFKEKNEYTGNGWSKYQMMVLDQLQGHTHLLETLMKEITEIKRHIAVSDMASKNWRDNTDEKITYLQQNVDNILFDEKGINSRLRKMEEDHKIQEHSALRFKASWGLIGGGLVVVIDIILKSVSAFVHFNP